MSDFLYGLVSGLNDYAQYKALQEELQQKRAFEQQELTTRQDISMLNQGYVPTQGDMEPSFNVFGNKPYTQLPPQVDPYKLEDFRLRQQNAKLREEELGLSYQRAEEERQTQAKSAYADEYKRLAAETKNFTDVPPDKVDRVKQLMQGLDMGQGIFAPKKTNAVGGAINFIMGKRGYQKLEFQMPPGEPKYWTPAQRRSALEYLKSKQTNQTQSKK